MNVGAIMRGVVVGLVCAGILALALALLSANMIIGPRIMRGLIWLASGITAIVAGIMAGQRADQAGWFHGAVAAVTLTLIGTAIAETLRTSNGHDLWLSLGVAALSGFIGGMMGTAIGY